MISDFAPVIESVLFKVDTRPKFAGYSHPHQYINVIDNSMEIKFSSIVDAITEERHPVVLI